MYDSDERHLSEYEKQYQHWQYEAVLQYAAARREVEQARLDKPINHEYIDSFVSTLVPQDEPLQQVRRAS